jgi:hypothetical protein
MTNATGILYSLAVSVSHAHAFILSNCSDEAFLSAIDQVKVSKFAFKKIITNCKP